jgi:hypothetical protein
VADPSRWAGSAGACHLRETHRFISRVDPARGGARRRGLLGRVALSGAPGTLDSPTTLTPSSSASRPAHPSGGGVDMHNAPGSPASGADAECASWRLAVAAMAPAAMSGAPAKWRKEQRPRRPGGRWPAPRLRCRSPCLPSLFLRPGAAHGTHASPISGSSSGQEAVAFPQIFFVKRHAFDADHMELAGVRWPCPPRATAADVMRDTVTVVILGTTVPLDGYPHRV